MLDREKIIRIIDELIFEAQKEPTWKAENALRCVKKELLKEQEAVKPFSDDDGAYWCGSCHEDLVWHQKFCSNCGKPVLWESR